jgi:hypothetical protein
MSTFLIILIIIACISGGGLLIILIVWIIRKFNDRYLAQQSERDEGREQYRELQDRMVDSEEN